MGAAPEPRIIGNKTIASIIQGARSEGRLTLVEPEVKTICLEYTIPVPMFRVANDPKDAIRAARDVGYPVVLKIVSPDILHKTDVGGVLVGVSNDEDVASRYNQILKACAGQRPDAKVMGVLVQHMAPKGTEVIVGGLRDPQFGPTVMFGLGGVFVEVLNDVTFRIVPITEHDAQEMLSEISARQVLKGFRGASPADEKAIISILLGASRLMSEIDEISQLDLNPIMVYEKGAAVVDARAILSQVNAIAQS